MKNCAEIDYIWEFLEFSGVTLYEIITASTFESLNAKLQAA